MILRLSLSRQSLCRPSFDASTEPDHSSDASTLSGEFEPDVTSGLDGANGRKTSRHGIGRPR
ncbi:MAG: hypothetical protein AAFQ22_04150 [Pseudomonadota bacterium]